MRSLRHHASVRLELRRAEAIKEGDDVVGSRIRAIVKKSKVAPPFRMAEFDILYDRGISRADDLIALGMDRKLIEASEGVYSYREMVLGREQAEVRHTLCGDPALAREIENRIRASAGLPSLAAPAVAEAAAAQICDCIAELCA